MVISEYLLASGPLFLLRGAAFALALLQCKEAAGALTLSIFPAAPEQEAVARAGLLVEVISGMERKEVSFMYLFVPGEETQFKAICKRQFNLR